MRIHLARWIITPDHPPMENGGVATFGGRIVAVGSAVELRRNFHGEVTDHGNAILCPALVNCHCHLELSHLSYRLKPSEQCRPGGFSDWVRKLIRIREQEGHGACWEDAVEDAMLQMADNGIAVLGDVGNGDLVLSFVQRSRNHWPLAGIYFKEIIAPINAQQPELPEPRIKRLSSPSAMPFFAAVSAHAPYTVAPDTLKAIDNWNRGAGTPFTIHAAESPDETEFFKSGTGPLQKLVEERGHWPPDWKIPGTSSVQYLESLGCLHEKTVLIHCVQADSEDLDIIAENRASVCLCPGSNRFIGVGKAPSCEMYKRGINIALGTDSLASNRKLSILSEMAQLASDAPELPPEAILKAATAGGAKALGHENDFGRLEPGKSALMLLIRGECATAGDALEFTVCQAHRDTVNVSLIEG